MAPHFVLIRESRPAAATGIGQAQSRETGCPSGGRVGLSVGEGSLESPNRFFFYPIPWEEVWKTAHFSAPLSESNRS